MRVKLATAAVVVIGSISILFAVQGRGGPLTGYTNKSVPLGAVDTKAADALCNSQRGHARLLCLAESIKKDATPELLAKLQLEYSVANASRWSNFPPMGYRNRVGPTLGELSPSQLVVVKAMLKTAAGIAADEGYDEIEQILNADDYLKANTNDTGFASGNFHVAFLGTPTATGTWQLYFGGHHLAFGATYNDGVMVGATPSFRGVEPFTRFEQNGRSNQPMVQETLAFAAMLTGLSDAERTKARLSQTYTDILVGPQRDRNFPPSPSGLSVGELSRERQLLVTRAIETYVRDINPQDADAILKKYATELANTYVSFSGTPTMNAENDYVRIDGPSVWIELSMQPGRSLPGIHPHSVWRDKSTDYGGHR